MRALHIQQHPEAYEFPSFHQKKLENTVTSYRVGCCVGVMRQTWPYKHEMPRDQSDPNMPKVFQFIKNTSSRTALLIVFDRRCGWRYWLSYEHVFNNKISGRDGKYNKQNWYSILFKLATPHYVVKRSYIAMDESMMPIHEQKSCEFAAEDLIFSVTCQILVLHVIIASTWHTSWTTQQVFSFEVRVRYHHTRITAVLLW